MCLAAFLTLNPAERQAFESLFAGLDVTKYHQVVEMIDSETAALFASWINASKAKFAAMTYLKHVTIINLEAKYDRPQPAP